jgi:transcription-repair coupling factor (superfamily II helicase)
VAAVGFDLYTRLLAQAVKRRKSAKRGEEATIEPPESILIDLPLAAYIPTDYVPESSLRLRLYRRMAALDSLEEIDEMAAELADRFGPIPDPVDNLLYQLRIKVLAQKAYVSGVATESGQVQIRFAVPSGDNRPLLQTALGPGVRISRKGIWLGRGLTTREWQVSLVQILEQLQVIAEGEKELPTKTMG